MPGLHSEGARIRMQGCGVTSLQRYSLLFAAYKATTLLIQNASFVTVVSPASVVDFALKSIQNAGVDLHNL